MNAVCECECHDEIKQPSEPPQATRTAQHTERARQYQIDAACAPYYDAWMAWTRDPSSNQQPRIEDFIARHPQYEGELLQFAVYLACEPPMPFEESETLELSPAGEKALAAIRAAWAEQQQHPDSR